jgi:hypothetical protein
MGDSSHVRDLKLILMVIGTGTIRLCLGSRRYRAGTVGRAGGKNRQGSHENTDAGPRQRIKHVKHGRRVWKDAFKASRIYLHEHRFNYRRLTHKQTGHVFSGRYMTLLVEGSGSGCLTGHRAAL